MTTLTSSAAVPFWKPPAWSLYASSCLKRHSAITGTSFNSTARTQASRLMLPRRTSGSPKLFIWSARAETNGFRTCERRWASSLGLSTNTGTALRYNDGLQKFTLLLDRHPVGQATSGDVLACIQQLAKNFEKLIQDNPNEPEFQRTLAGAYYYLVLGPFVESDRVRWNDKAVEIWEKLTREHPTVASYRMDLARALEQRAGMRFSGREQQADQAAQKALLLRQELAREFPARSTNNVWLAASYRTMAEVQVARNDHKAAEKTLRDALKLQQILVLNSPAVPAYQEELAKTEQELAGALTKLRRPQEAAEACRLALETSGRLVASFPKVTTYRVMHLQAARNLAQVLQSVGRGNEGTLVIRRAIGVYQTLKESAAGSAGDRLALAESFKSFATFLEEIGEQEEAERAARKVIEIYETLMTDFPNVPDYPSALGVFVHNMPSNGAKQADMPERYERAIRYQQIALKMAPGDTRYRTHFGNHYLGLANALMWVGEHAKAKEAYDQAIVIKQKLAADFPNDAQYRESLAQGNLTIATDLMVFDRLKDAEQPARQALELFEKLAADFPTAPAYQESLVKCRFQISLLAGRLGRTQEALQGYRRVIELSPKNAPAHDNLARMLATCPDPRFRDSAKAVEHAKRAVELAAKEGVFWNTLGVAQLLRGRLEGHHRGDREVDAASKWGRQFRLVFPGHGPLAIGRQGTGSEVV